MPQIQSIGVIHSPYQCLEDMPIQPKGASEVKGEIVLDPQYAEGLADLEGFSHIYLIYHFHKAIRTELRVTPFMDTQPRGVFSTRSPLRPNHIGMSVLEVSQVVGNRVYVQGIDILDGTPLLDIKPYIAKFDAVAQSRSGWLQASEQEIVNKRSDQRFV
ncbi:tRNA (N6-threonylcarbamoyladenosine(37)-N6)-methyltransferase TrmO [Agarivorans sp. Z349TD_8]|uniref:tRNA (N6-threonylcarbamoyladenosine(37)-N6)-methyltransferase TrmO n=1 Tax=Agarivorans sp. Z349TD_8 TaxID=3421434 RepID=UPI003D7D9CAB